MTQIGTEVMAVVGRFDANEAPAFNCFVEEHFSAASRLGIDLSQVTFIDSTALAELISLHKANAIDLTLLAPADVVRVILELTALDQVFTIDRDALSNARLKDEVGSNLNSHLVPGS